MEKTTFDPVTHPSHYTMGREIEPLDVMEDWGVCFHLASTIKYISRAGRKQSYVQDLEKALFYVNRCYEDDWCIVYGHNTLAGVSYTEVIKSEDVVKDWNLEPPLAAAIIAIADGCELQDLWEVLPGHIQLAIDIYKADHPDMYPEVSGGTRG